MRTQHHYLVAVGERSVDLPGLAGELKSNLILVSGQGLLLQLCLSVGQITVMLAGGALLSAKQARETKN